MSLRTKIAGLFTAVLTVSFVAYLYVALSLFSRDKMSYIYDFNFARVNETGQALENQVDQAFQFSSQIASLTDSRVQVPQESLKYLFEKQAGQFGVEGLLVLRPVDLSHFSVAFEVGPSSTRLKAVLAQSGWSPGVFDRERVLVRGLGDDVALGSTLQDRASQPIAFIALMKFHAQALGARDRDLQVFLLDPSGSVLLKIAAPAQGFDVLAGQATLIAQSFSGEGSGASSGASSVTVAGGDYINVHRKLKFGGLTLMGFTPKGRALSVLRTLKQRFSILGLGVLLVAVGLSIGFARRLTLRLRQMWNATKKAREGDFSFRVDASGSSRDEVTDLALSFNSMAERIDDLLKETADKARMEKELETAQEVQRRFFPTAPFKSEVLSLAGAYAPASECAGDWWNYVQIGPQLITVIGDVTGHGVGAALVTAGVHGAFRRYIEGLNASPRRPSRRLLEELMSELNFAVYLAAQGSAEMTLTASVVDLDLNTLTLATASHLPAYLFREGSMQPLIPEGSVQLGANRVFEANPISVQLHPGDTIFWYSDGVFERRSSDQAKIRKLQFLQSITELTKAEGVNAQVLCEDLMKSTITFFGGPQTSRPDDITFVIATVPREASAPRQAA
jgi:sigma-B regulation protein RsbU (phosphoserine phosphatase)